MGCFDCISSSFCGMRIRVYSPPRLCIDGFAPSPLPALLKPTSRSPLAPKSRTPRRPSMASTPVSLSVQVRGPRPKAQMLSFLADTSRTFPLAPSLLIRSRSFRITLRTPQTDSFLAPRTASARSSYPGRGLAFAFAPSTVCPLLSSIPQRLRAHDST